MDPFAQAVEGWHDFYLMVGAAAEHLVLPLPTIDTLGRCPAFGRQLAWSFGL